VIPIYVLRIFHMQAIKDRNKVTAKYTNDLMHGLYTTTFMAAHSVTWVIKQGGDTSITPSWRC